MESIENMNFMKIDLKSDVDTLFPSTIWYPGQNEDHNSDNKANKGINNSNINIETNSNINNLNNTNNTNSNINPNTHRKKNYKLSSKKYIIDFFENEAQTLNPSDLKPIYDVFIKGDLIIACGGNYIKVFSKSKLEESISELNFHPYSYFNNFNNENKVEPEAEKSSRIKISLNPEVTFQDLDEEFYSVSYIETSSTQQLLAAGGSSKIIKIIDLKQRTELHQLIGHRNEILDLKFYQSNQTNLTNNSSNSPTLLLSASQDFSIRLWNPLTNCQICIFAGSLRGHNSDVLSIDWHFSGKYFVSSGCDHCVKIWQINDEIQANINKSQFIKSHDDKIAHKFKTKITGIPIFSCDSIHDNYVDCVKFNGNFVISKSVEGLIYEWKPVFNKEEDSVFIINTYVYKMESLIWYMKFDVDFGSVNSSLGGKEIIGVGNDKGVFYVFNVGCEGEESIVSKSSDDKNIKLGKSEKSGKNYSLKQNNSMQFYNYEDHFFTKWPSDEYQFEEEYEDIVRSVSIDKTSDWYILGQNGGKLTIGSFCEC